METSRDLINALRCLADDSSCSLSFPSISKALSPTRRAAARASVSHSFSADASRASSSDSNSWIRFTNLAEKVPNWAAAAADSTVVDGVGGGTDAPGAAELEKVLLFRSPPLLPPT